MPNRIDFKENNIFNTDSTEGTLMITPIADRPTEWD